jgi:hypothetical protein
MIPLKKKIWFWLWYCRCLDSNPKHFVLFEIKTIVSKKNLQIKIKNLIWIEFLVK